MSKKFFLLFISLLILITAVFAKTVSTDTINIRNLKSGLTLRKFWTYKVGDDIAWSDINYDYSGWRLIIADSTENDTILNSYAGIVWFRSSFVIDSLIENIPLAIQTRTNGACEIFIDGRLIRSMGKVGKTEQEQISAFSIRTNVIPIPVNTKGRHQIAVRSSGFVANSKLGKMKLGTGLSFKDFELTILSAQKAIEEEKDVDALTIPMFFSGAFIVLSIFHMVLFLYYRKNRSNLYYSLFTLFMFFIFFGIYLTISGTDLDTTKYIFILGFYSFFLVPLFFISILYEVFYKKLLRRFWILSGMFAGSIVCVFILNKLGLGVLLLLVFLFAALIETVRVMISALRKKKEGSRIFIFGLLFPVIGLIILSIISWLLEKAGFHDFSDKLSDHEGAFFGYSFLMSVSISMTIYLARDFAKMNKKLYDQIREIKQLFNRTVEQETERKKILENQKEELERMVIVRTEEVVRQKAEIELKNRDILDNLLYARRIQEAILPEIRLIYKALSESFILYWPKDIVSGDFYSFSQKDDRVIIAAADCTGHGVTGAFMSMIGSSILNQIINERGITQPSLILNHLNNGIAEALKQNETEVNDGMDICLCNIDIKNMVLEYAGANRPLWIVRDGEILIIKPDKLAIGGFHIRKNATFTNHEIKLMKGDTFYLFTDGFADQFGGQHGKKLLSKHLREVLISMQHLSMKEQEKELTRIFYEWKGKVTQVDDVLVIGIRV